MRAVNNTLREIILRERPLTVTNNDSLVLSSPGPWFSSLRFSLLHSPLPLSLSLSLFLSLRIHSLVRNVYNVPRTVPRDSLPISEQKTLSQRNNDVGRQSIAIRSTNIEINFRKLHVCRRQTFSTSLNHLGDLSLFFNSFTLSLLQFLPKIRTVDTCQ